MVSLGQHLQIQRGGTCLFPVQLYPLTLVFALSNLVSFPAVTETALSAKCTTWIASRASWALLVPCEMTFRWCKDLGNNTGLWEQFLISQLWVVQRCVGCDQLQTWYSWISDSVLFPFFMVVWAIALEVLSFMMQTSYTAHHRSQSLKTQLMLQGFEPQTV